MTIPFPIGNALSKAVYFIPMMHCTQQVYCTKQIISLANSLDSGQPAHSICMLELD